MASVLPPGPLSGLVVGLLLLRGYQEDNTPSLVPMQRYDTVHSSNGVELDVLSTIAEDLEAAWVIARESFPQEHVMVLSVEPDA